MLVVKETTLEYNTVLKKSPLLKYLNFHIFHFDLRRNISVFILYISESKESHFKILHILLSSYKLFSRRSIIMLLYISLYYRQCLSDKIVYIDFYKGVKYLLIHISVYCCSTVICFGSTTSF